MHQSLRRHPIAKVVVKAPLRVDFAGGTLDIPPLFIMHAPAPVVNTAITMYATVTITPSKKFVVVSRDQNISASSESHAALSWKRCPRLELMIRLAKSFPVKRNIRIEVFSDAPHGSGLGASSAIAVALTTALARWVGVVMSKKQIVEHAKNIETQTIRVPAGYQDHWAAAYGGLKTYRNGLDGTMRHASPASPNLLTKIEQSLLLVYTRPHFSGANNWALFKQYFDRDLRTIGFFALLQKSALAMEKAMERGSIKGVADAMNHDWKLRRAVIPGMTTPEIERLTKLAFRSGAFGLRACGAGGGGCVAVLIEPKKKEDLIKKIERAGMQVFTPKISRKGVTTKR
jgi:D-glycero-alpha-D-manno-heptose-7-phosphate kinase